MTETDPNAAAMCQAYQGAIFEKNVDAFINLYHPSARVFDTWGVWSYEGADERRKVIEQWFSSLGDERVRVTLDRVQTVTTPEMIMLSARAIYAAISPVGDELRSMQNRLSWVLKSEAGT